MKKYIAIILALSITNVTFASAPSEVSEIKAIIAGEGLVRVKLNTMKSVEGCASQEFYALDLSNNINNYMFSTLLTAKASGKKVSFLLDSCIDLSGTGNVYPKIKYIYFCDTQWCNL